MILIWLTDCNGCSFYLPILPSVLTIDSQASYPPTIYKFTQFVVSFLSSILGDPGAVSRGETK